MVPFEHNQAYLNRRSLSWLNAYLRLAEKELQQAKRDEDEYGEEQFRLYTSQIKNVIISKR